LIEGKEGLVKPICRSRIALQLLGLILGLHVAHSQSLEQLLLPEEVVISGNVVNTAGEPIGKAYVEHASTFFRRGAIVYVHDVREIGYATDDFGRFSIRTRSPFLVFMKPGYISRRIRIDQSGHLRVTLDPATPKFSFCPETTKCESAGFFCFPQIEGIVATPVRLDVDYLARAFNLDRPGAGLGIWHGHGPMWGDGRPINTAWNSIEYDESVFNSPYPYLVDARGKTPDGKLWRYLGTVNESAEYRGVDSADASKLDQVLDGMCVFQSDPLPPEFRRSPYQESVQ
jgi:hypothetical protein